MICDLHCHTKLSDGSLGIEDIIAQAKRTGIEWLSITDHDTMASFSRSDVLGEREGVKILHGTELSAWDKKRNRKVHILCYEPKKPDRLEGLCLKSCEIRKACSKEMINKVMEKFPITIESILKHTTASKSIFKQHIMRALIDYGYALEMYGDLDRELFNPQTGSCYVEREYPDAHRETLVVLDGTTGQNALAQAKQFGEVADITGIILTKLDGTAKGGIAIAIQSELHVPVKYIGIGEQIDDLQKFDADQFVDALFE